MANSVKKYVHLHDRSSAIDMRPADALEELQNLMKLCFAETKRVADAINAELTIYESMIDRAGTQMARDELRLRQARAAQKKAIDPRLVDSLCNVINSMKDLATECNGGAEITFINDFDVTDSDSGDNYPRRAAQGRNPARVLASDASPNVWTQRIPEGDEDD